MSVNLSELFPPSSSSGGGGGGEFVHIGANPPASPEEGQQWMEVPASGDATMWIYDGDKWLQQPGGKDGADGIDGADGGIEEAPNDGLQYARQSEGWAEVKGGLWTDDGGGSISYSGIAKVGSGANGHKLEVEDDRGKTLLNSYVLQFGRAGSCYIQNRMGGDIFIEGDAGNLARFQQNKDLVVYGGISKNGSTPLMGTDDMIGVLSTLREATKDETTIKGLRDAIGNAVGGLIEKFEAMQSPVTQEIADE